MLENLEVLPELGRQHCFELGNSFYCQYAADRKEPGNEQGNYYRKELPTGEIFLVALRVSAGEGENYIFNETLIRQLR